MAVFAPTVPNGSKPKLQPKLISQNQSEYLSFFCLMWSQTWPKRGRGKITIINITTAPTSDLQSSCCWYHPHDLRTESNLGGCFYRVCRSFVRKCDKTVLTVTPDRRYTLCLTSPLKSVMLSSAITPTLENYYHTNLPLLKVNVVSLQKCRSQRKPFIYEEND